MGFTMSRYVKLLLVCACVMAPYAAFVVYFTLLGPTQAKSFPMWAIWAGGCCFIGSIIALPFVGRRFLRVKTQKKDIGEDTGTGLSHKTRLWKKGLFLYCGIFVFGIANGLAKGVPVKYGIGAFVLNFLLVFIVWRGFSRARKAESLKSKPSQSDRE